MEAVHRVVTERVESQQKPCILVIDDNALNLKLAQEILTASGYEVVTAVSGEAGITMARSRRPALILLDIQLPDIDGLQVLGRLRQLPETKATTVVAVTAQAMTGDRERFLAAGCNGYIPKPFSIRTLSGQVAQYLKQDQHEDAPR